MSIHYNKQSQFELFPGAVAPSTDTKRSGFFRTTLTVSIDNLVVLSIVVLMFLVVAYSIGIERGKFLVRLKNRPVQYKTVSVMLAPKPLVITKVVARRPPATVTNVPSGTRVPGSLMNAPGRPATQIRPIAGRNATKLTARPVSTVPAQEMNQRPPIVSPSAVRSTKGPASPVKGAVKPVQNLEPRVPLRTEIVKAGLSVPLLSEKTANSLSTNSVKTISGGVEKKIDNSYTVQVASYANVQDAQRAMTDLKRRGMDAALMPKGKYTILCVGNFNAKPEAEKASRKLKRQFKDCVIRSL